ncbi:germinal-center associated nuclear protein-like [Brienomyrus brachyistius]|uniref:germinal-center associated nuclear protein-like n=1 Tax=Brienomyrus brachyistius TaxID=42636 RepID=UPI0020B379BE|nr:germinal-center associated nuclear protein-like [Brienomyrus brachyistius]
MAPTTSHSPSTPPRSQAPTREVLERAEELDPETEAASTVRRARRLDSTDSLGGMSPSEAMVLQCKNIPASLNSKDILGEHFRQFGRVQRIFCRPQKNLAIVHFHDHASAAKAKKKGKLLRRHELTIFWQRKKQSPGEKGQRPPDDPDPQSQAGGFESAPVCKALSKSTSGWSSSSSLSRGSPAKKPLATKALQFESEPQMEPSPDGLESEHLASSLPSPLFHLIGPKRTDLDLSKVFVGTCPDMCPEKERYMRETRNQLSSFEVIPNTEKVDHTAAIKEYSRSSADQEEPLPHELRPLTVLNMTMNYLVTQVMDQGEDNYRDWYDFVWNRTRGIRKDITQQHLCDPLTVSLIEKCARFHIHCAHHLCQEPMMSFDAKINNENLTKCLQSLKEMYQDLASKNIYCPHEAEFRQYSVLLKLNDGDILREVQQFRAELRNSPEVKFAVQAFAAVNSNNFVRFFKLVKVASYLAGCILHRYFDQVRREALRALNVAYSSRGSTTFPVEDLVRMLMFQNAGEASDLALQYGLAVDAGMVELSRTAYQEPEIQPRPKRSVAIARKREVLVGQVVNGAPLPNPPQHTPVNSFDSRNKYRGDGQPAEAYISAALSMCNGQVEAVLSEVVEQMLREVSAAEIQAEREHIAEEKRRMEEARRKQEHEELLARLSKTLCAEITQEVLRDCIVETASTEIRRAQEEQAECVARSSQDVCEVLLEETLCGELTLLAQDVLEAELLSIRRFIKRWRDVVAVRRQLKRQMRDFPAAPGCVDPRFRLQALAPSAGSEAMFLTVGQVARGPLSEEGQLALEKRKGLMGMGALLMLLPSAVSPGADEEDGDIFLLSALLQLRQIQQANAWPQALPLVVVVPGQAGHRASDERLEEDLMLQTLIEEGLISEYMFVHIPETTNEPQGSEQIRHAVRWLAARSTAPARLVSQTLVQVVEAGLCREFAGRLHRDRRDRDMAGLPSQGPAPVIGLYNTVLAFLAGLVSSPSLAGLSWPVAEFLVPGGGDCLPHLLWNSAEHLEWLQGAVLSLRLPDWPLPAVGAPWSQLVASIFQYVSQIPWSRHSQPLLMSQLENLLERLRQDCVGRGGGPDKEPTFWEVPWDEIVMLCVEHQLRDWNPPGCPVSEDVISDDGEISVYFLSDGLQGFIPPSCWVDAVKQTHRDKQQGKAGCHQSMWPHPRLARPRLQQKLFHSMVEDPESGSGVAPVLDAASSPQDLLARIEEEKEQSRRFEDQLRTWLDVESLGPSSSSSPLFLPSSLLSVPEIVVPSPKMAAPPALALQKERSVRSDQARGAASSMARRLQELEQLISASREEELACELKLSCLLDIVDD